MDSSQVNLRHLIQTPAFNHKFRRDQPTPRSYPATMNSNEMSSTVKQEESMGLGMWPSTQTPQNRRPRPATIHETGFSYCMPQEYSSLPAWDSSTMPMQQSHEVHQQTYSVQPNYYQSSSENSMSSSLLYLQFELY